VYFVPAPRVVYDSYTVTKKVVRCLCAFFIITHSERVTFT
jgi:hypothetical protein